MPKRVTQQKKKQTRHTRRKKQQKKRYTRNQKKKRGGNGDDLSSSLLPPPPPLSPPSPPPPPSPSPQPSPPRSSSFKTPSKRSHSLSVLERPCKKNKKLTYTQDELNVISKVERIGSDSKSGNLIKIDESKSGMELVYFSGTSIMDSFVLKIPKRDTITNIVDNIVYEFEVGLFINKHFRPCYPCFLQTYDLIHTEDQTMIQMYMNNKDLYKRHIEEKKRKETFSTLKVILPNIDSIDSIDSIVCTNKHKYAVKIQYVPNGKTLFDLLSESILDEYDINAILLQIYAPLCNINEKKETTFVHNDLHFNNIYVITLEKPINIVYKFPSSTITITTQYLAKMIDYGRCHIPETKEFQNEYSTLDDKEQKESYQSYLINCGMRHVLYELDDLYVFNNVQKKLLEKPEYNCKTLHDAYDLLENFFNEVCDPPSVPASFILIVDGEKMTYEGNDIPDDLRLFGENVMSQVTTANTTPSATSYKKIRL